MPQFTALPRFTEGAGQDNTLRTATQSAIVARRISAATYDWVPTADKNLLVIVEPIGLEYIKIYAHNLKVGDTCTIVCFMGEGEALMSITAATPNNINIKTSPWGNVYNFVCTGVDSFPYGVLALVSKFEYEAP